MSSSAWQIQAAEPTDWRSVDVVENLFLNESIPIPSAQDLLPKTALVRIRAVAINARDVMVIAHDPLYPILNKENLIPCADGVGEISAVGQDSIWKVGDRVMIHPVGWTYEQELPDLIAIEGKGAGDIDGTLRQFTVLEDSHLLAAPETLTFEQAASIPCCGATAINALFCGPVSLSPNMTILTQGTGGVSCFCIQIASYFGCTVISTSSSDAKLVTAKRLGATHTVNYTTHPDWDEEVLRLTNGKGVDHVLEIGGGGTIEKSIKCLRHGGLVSLIGFLAGSKKVDLTSAILFGGKTLRGVFGFNKIHVERLINFVDMFELKPEVAKVFEWKDAKEAFKESMVKEIVGKIVIKV
ncbi:hypothetical protein QTJ16_005146 [Diplocarpon rosae]|uniref:Enoyl reductase (ER) domain-containing protein n=1 Tax=Diplocarpon rosae TaxID=946125 RepID=A0AAD9WEC4_9HELO|nr:hypothetical protein QTJ16_005146 [Diplocarpon rosae]